MDRTIITCLNCAWNVHATCLDISLKHCQPDRKNARERILHPQVALMLTACQEFRIEVEPRECSMVLLPSNIFLLYRNTVLVRFRKSRGSTPRAAGASTMAERSDQICTAFSRVFNDLCYILCLSLSHSAQILSPMALFHPLTENEHKYNSK